MSEQLKASGSALGKVVMQFFIALGIAAMVASLMRGEFVLLRELQSETLVTALCCGAYMALLRLTPP